MPEIFGDTVRYGTGPESLADALLDAIKDPDPARQNRGRALAPAHTWSAAARRHLSLYRAFVA